jgi:hypothetical protein
MLAKAKAALQQAYTALPPAPALPRLEQLPSLLQQARAALPSAAPSPPPLPAAAALLQRARALLPAAPRLPRLALPALPWLQLPALPALPAPSQALASARALVEDAVTRRLRRGALLAVGALCAIAFAYGAGAALPAAVTSYLQSTRGGAGEGEGKGPRR